MSQPFVAEIKIFAGNYAPRDFAVCDGALLPISQNTALFSLVGTIYGGDGETSFGLPDLRDRAPMHPGNGPGLSQRGLAEKGGTASVALTANQLGSHRHTPQGFADVQTANPTSTRGPGSAAWYATPGTLVDLAPGTLGDTGGGAAHNNYQPLLSLDFIIALNGVFPS